MLMRPDHSAIDNVQVPVQLVSDIGLLWDHRKEALPDARIAPAVESAGHCLPGAIALGYLAPRSPCTEEPPDAIDPGCDDLQTGGRFWIVGVGEAVEAAPIAGWSIHVYMYSYQGVP